MPITVYPITPGFVAEVGDVDLSQPLSAGEVAEIKQAFWDFGVVVFPDQNLTDQQHLDFAAHIGPLEISIAALNKDAKLRIRAELADVSNLNLRDEIWSEASRLRALAKANRLWHTDSSFKHLPARASLLYARKIPPIGG